jgi:nucleotide-binding universal stress UspA family protein
LIEIRSEPGGPGQAWYKAHRDSPARGKAEVPEMKNQTFLMLMTEDTEGSEVRQVAETAAAMNARLTCLLLSTMPTQPMNAHGAFPYGGFEISDQWVEEVNETRERLKARMEGLRDDLTSAGASGDVQIALAAHSDIRAEVARRGFVSDFAIASKSIRAAENGFFRDVAYSVLFETPIPLMLNATPLKRAGRIFVGWDTQLPAARAVHAALPLLKEADEVIVASFDPVALESADGEDPGADLSKWLSHHGCKVTLNQYPSGGEPIGAAIRRRAKESGADLVVMGAYGKSRLRERVFGGTTQSMIEQTDMPVFLAH